MIIQYIKFKTELSEDEVFKTAHERLPQFQMIPGLVQKYYVRTAEPDTYGGVYIWESQEALQEFRGSELAATIPQAYKIVGKPEIQILDVLFPLRE